MTDSTKFFGFGARARAFAVHLLTASGAGLAFLALLEAVREHWSLMFAWLGVALLVDGIDGPIARRLDVVTVLPDWSGDTLDLVVDFLTYVFVPAYAIATSHLLPPVVAPVIGLAIVMSGALYFADRRMKTYDNHFRGFPGLWNAAAFYLFLLKPTAAWASVVLAGLVVLTFVPIHTIHPLRTRRGRFLTLLLLAVWALLAVFALIMNFDVGNAVKVTLVAIALYILFVDLGFRTYNWIRS
ncbi:MAG: phosphatidylcholine synthase [Xanthobacteraceae bacterium]|nr:phosphatidylcholine synthase [Xanthobacteraceae bacterium]